MSKGLVYILTNPCLNGWIKIGMTERNDIADRLRELNAPTNLPLCYRCYAVYEVEDPSKVEKNIHGLIDLVDSSLHARETLENGRIREREFFKISRETAFGIFKRVAALRGDSDALHLYQPSQSELQDEELAETRSKRSNNSFQLLHIDVGEVITFLYDDNITARVLNQRNKVEYQGEAYSVSALASKLLHERCGWSENASVNGWQYFSKDNVTLSDLRDIIEAAEAVADESE